VLAGFALLSLASTKRNIYLLPLYPLLAILCAERVQAFAGVSRAAATLERVAFGAQAVVATVLAIAVAGLIFALSGPYFGDRAPGGYVALAIAVAFCALAGSVIVWRAFAARGRERFAIAVLAQAVAGLVVFAVVCLPFLESEKGFSTFFANAVRIERERGRTPRLFTRHESYTGFAGLHFGVLEHLTLRCRVPPALEIPVPVDVITDTPGLGTLRSAMPEGVTVLTEQRTRGRGAPHALYLVEVALPHRELAAAEMPRDARAGMSELSVTDGDSTAAGCVPDTP
jgi:hypothetical protein